MGYSLAGVVIAVGDRVPDFKPGDRVACAGAGFASHAQVACVPRTLCALVPEDVGLDEAAFATLGAVALQGVRQAEPTLGEVVLVIGLGLLGLLTVQLLRAAGCRAIGVDVDAARCALARQLGADAATTPDDPALDLIARRRAPTGVDAAILTAATSSSDPIRLAGKLCRDRARIVVVGAVGLDIPRSPFYEKELDIRMSRSYGPGRYDPEHELKGHDYPIGYVRWTEGRNLASFLDLVEQGKVDVKALTTHRFAIEQAERAYALIEGTGEPYLGVLLDHGLPAAPSLGLVPGEPVPVKPPIATSGRMGVALIGAGGFAQGTLLPHLAHQQHVRLKTVVDIDGLAARSAAGIAGFERCGSDAQAIFADPDISLVLIASRHASHASLTARALRAAKAVFVEKPLALDLDDLHDVISAWQAAASPFVMVGFNRRFSSAVAALREFLRGAGEPLLMHYRVNAGFIPRSHWVQDPDEGGGRVLGEVCHFVDLLQFLCGSAPVDVVASALPDSGRYSSDNVAAAVRFADGSLGSITYAANGDAGLPKERIEAFGGGLAAVLDDFRDVTLFGGGRRTARQFDGDKGHRAEMLALIDAVRTGAPSPLPFEQLVLATRATIAIRKSLQTGERILVAD
jgi:polar amino acid transport system substrate-binding protein